MNEQALVKELSEAVRNRIHSGLSFWHQIPLLQLNAEGLTGFTDNMSLIFIHGLYPIKSLTDSYFIDLATGEMVCLVRSDKYSHEYICVPRVMNDDEIIQNYSYIRDLDPKEIVRDLKKKIKAGFANWYSNEKQQETLQWQRDTRVKNGLDEKFVRTRSLEVRYNFGD